MSRKIRVILLEDIPTVGVTGDIVSVMEGFARNALFPAGRAALATEEHITRAEKNKRASSLQAENNFQQLQEQVRLIDGTELTISAQTKNDDDEIYGKITTVHIAKQLRGQTRLNIRAKDISLAAPITRLGTQTATIAFGSGLEATIQIIIKKKVT